MKLLDPPTNFSQVMDRIGNVPLERLPYPPAPGMATEIDVLRRPGGEKRLYELVEGVLVEKSMGYLESRIAVILIHLLESFLSENDLGVLTGPDSAVRLEPGLVRAPDVCFISWDRFPNRALPEEQIPDVAPDLAVEIISPSNTEAEMRRKVREYLAAGSRLVWLIDPRTRTARAFTPSAAEELIPEQGSLDGGDVLPGFNVPLARLFPQ